MYKYWASVTAQSRSPRWSESYILQILSGFNVVYRAITRGRERLKTGDNDVWSLKSTSRYLLVSHTYKHVLLRYITDMTQGMLRSHLDKSFLRAKRKNISPGLWSQVSEWASSFLCNWFLKKKTGLRLPLTFILGNFSPDWKLCWGKSVLKMNTRKTLFLSFKMLSQL